jgi:hypothetical protein
MVKPPIDFVKQQMVRTRGFLFEYKLNGKQAAGTAEESFAGNWLKKNLSPEEEDILTHAAGSMFGGK